jgi:hypothetical protein
MSLSIVFATLGCGTQTPEDSDTKAVIDVDARRWPDPRHIPICFLNRNAVHADLYDDLLKNTVHQFARAGVAFKKWRDCTKADMNDNIIRVRFKSVYNWDNSSYSYGGGRSKVGMSRTSLSGEDGATLFIKLDSRYPEGPSRKRDTVVRATRSVLLHEIGHALGLLHEHTRTDYDSVMSYCNLTADSLSKGDIAGIHALYPQLK